MVSVWEYNASGDRYLKSPDTAWSAYKRVMDRLVYELGDLKSRTSWVKATDGSITPSRESLDEAVAVLESDGLPFTYSFSSFISVGGDRVDVYVWTDQHWVKIVGYASSASRAKGLVAVGTDLMDVLGAAKDRPAPDIDEAAQPLRRKWPTWLRWTAGVTATAVIGGAVALFYRFVDVWLRSAGLLP
ncbi:hypothetical protein AKG07_00860 [Microbacterium sp. CGR1]|nr:hypothetical protein AKG07_00860 [Microbacterium sp. CGR1]